MDRVVWESRHKFVYYDEESIDSLRKLESDYNARIDSEEPIVVYVQDSGLPKWDTKKVLSRDIIKIFHEHYYQLLIFSEIINNIYNKINKDELNNRLERVFGLCSYMGKEKIKDIDTLKKFLNDSKNMYQELFMEYIESGQTNFYDRIPIPFVMIDNVITTLKKAIGLKQYFCLILEINDDLSLYSCMAVNDHIASRCNGYLSVNVLLHNDNEWKSYYANNGQFIQETHDYTEIDFRKHKIKNRSIHI